jgi:hypothetical protein
MLQTIDMNQDNYFEEALKMRNLLEEFAVSVDDLIRTWHSSANRRDGV